MAANKPKPQSSKPINPEWYAPITPRDKQWEAHAAACAHIRGPVKTEPAFIYASVGFGKTILLAMIAKQAQMVAESRNTQQLKILVMARTGDLIDQNAEKMWEIGARNSIFSASLKIKSLKYPVICGTEGTLARSLHKELGELIDHDTGEVIRQAKKFDILLIDEAYQVNYDEPDCQYMQLITELQRRNQNLIIIGYGGSLYRGTQPIIGPFWKHLIYSCSMWEAIEIGYCKPLLFGFGHDDNEYKGLEDIAPSGLDGTDDLSKELMDQQNKIIVAQKEVTQHIVREFVDIAKSRNCVLITCAGKKHITQVVEILRDVIGDFYEYKNADAPIGTIKYAIVTEETKTAERKEIKRQCNLGLIKYVLQVGAWTVGVNITMFDTIVILRKIGSRTLLEQLVGRGERWLEQWQKDMGFVSENNMVLDYAGTFESMGEFFDDQFIQTAQVAKAKNENQDTIQCGRHRCGAQNSSHARRCLGKDMKPAPIARLAPDPRGRLIPGKLLFIVEPDGRCGTFWGSPKICPQCTTRNDKVARSCRRCDFMLVDPNAALTNKHYTDNDFQNVVSGRVILSKDKTKIIGQWQLESGVVAKEVYEPSSKEKWKRATWVKFFNDHMPHAYAVSRGLNSFTPAIKLAAHLAMFNVPEKITHRVNEKGYDIIHRKQFYGGRQTKD